MTAPPGPFEEPEDEPSGPLLPPDDRLWRHPSEISQGALPSLDPAVVRRNWLEREPSRANVWTAGLVGALLATGVVIVGTHLASLLTRPRSIVETAVTSTIAPATDAPQALSETFGPIGLGLGSQMKVALEQAGARTALVDAWNGTEDSKSLGVVIGSDGTVLTASEGLIGATSVLVTLPGDNVTLVGAVTSDPKSGLAVIHVNGMSGIPTVRFATSAAPPPGSTAFVVNALQGRSYAAAAIANDDVSPEIGTSTLVDAVATDLPAQFAPLGGPVLGPNGEIVGITVGASNGRVVFVPGWLAAPVADELLLLGAVHHGVLGIIGAAPRSRPVAGVQVGSVVPHSAAARGGLATGDVIVAINSTPVSSMAELRGRLYLMRPNETVRVRYLRRGLVHVTRVTLDDADD